MGYPMTYNRILSRNMLGGNYTKVRQYISPNNSWVSDDRDANGKLVMHHAKNEMFPGFVSGGPLEYDPRLAIAGDLRRLEKDSLEPGYRRAQIAKEAGVDEETVVKVLSAFFEDNQDYCKLPNVPPHDDLWGWKYVEGNYYPPGCCTHCGQHAWENNHKGWGPETSGHQFAANTNETSDKP